MQFRKTAIHLIQLSKNKCCGRLNSRAITFFTLKAKVPPWYALKRGVAEFIVIKVILLFQSCKILQENCKKIVPIDYNQTELNCEKRVIGSYSGVIGRYSALYKIDYWPLTPNGAKRSDNSRITPGIHLFHWLSAGYWRMQIPVAWLVTVEQTGH